MQFIQTMMEKKIIHESSSEFTSDGENIEISSEQLKSVMESSSEDDTNAQQQGSEMHETVARSPSFEVKMKIQMSLKLSPVNGAEQFPITATNQNGNVSNSRSNSNS